MSHEDFLELTQTTVNFFLFKTIDEIVVTDRENANQLKAIRDSINALERGELLMS